MRKLTSFQIKLIVAIVLLIITIIGLFLFLTKSMTTINSNINITKIEAKDKIYTYDIYSDFYFNVVKYDEKGVKTAQFSQLVPTRTSIGFDFSKEKPELVLKNYDNYIELQLTSKNDNDVSKEIDIVKNFSKEYGFISAIQDEHYFRKNILKTKEIVENLYNVKTDFTFSIDKFYENEIPSIISNLYIKTPVLPEISKNLKTFQVCENKEWCPELLKWHFGEDDSISLEYVLKAEKIDLDDYLKELNKNVTITKITKINSNQVSKFFMVTPSDQNELRSYFMDNNGHIYLLRYKYKNPKSLEKYQNDYIKIAFGINFVDVKNFENKYAQLQNNLNKYKEELKEINELDKELIQYDIYEHFKLNSNLSISDDLKLIDIYTIYQNDDKFLGNIEKEYEEKKLLKEFLLSINPLKVVNLNPISNLKAIYKDGFLGAGYKSMGLELKQACPDLNCVKNLKSNNWKVEEKQ
jgi:hypothetical protein